MNLRIPLLAVGVALLVGIAFVFLLYQPLGQQEAAVLAETVDLQSQQAGLSAEIAELEQIRDNEPRIRELLSRHEELIPSVIAQPRALDEFESIAGTAGVSIRSVNFSDPVPANPVVAAPDNQQLGVITTTIVLESGYFPAVDFLRRLELEGPRAVLTQSVAVAEGDDGFPSLATTWTGQLFALIPADVVAGTAVAVPVPVPTATEAAAVPGAVPSPLPSETP